jgi:hypothetical protein
MIRDPAARPSPDGRRLARHAARNTIALVRVLALSLLAALSLSCAASPFAVRLGTERVVLDVPPGFADTLDLGSPRLQDLAETLTSASNRILLFAITDADLRRFQQGDTPEYRRYMLVATPKSLERERVGLNQFRDYVVESVRGLGNPAEPADIRKYLDAQPAGRAILLAELRRKPDAVSVFQGTRIPTKAKDKPVYLLSTTTLLLLQGKALNISVFTGYDDDSDPDWLRSVTLRWLEELQRLNRMP